MINQTPRHKTSDSATIPSLLRFGRTPPKGGSTGTGTSATHKSRFGPTDDHFENVELRLAEKAVPVGDEESQSHKAPGLLLHDSQ